MDKYYYLISQLPMLHFDRDPGLTIGGFREEASKWMSSRDFQRLFLADMRDVSPQKTDPDVLKLYKRFETAFRDDLAQWRRAQHEGTEHRPGSFSPAMVREGNPLDVEKRLLRHRWAFLESLEPEHHFDLDALVLYYLKLQILARIMLFDKDKGMERFRALCEETAAAEARPGPGHPGEAAETGA